MERRFSEQEQSEVFKRAIELQREAGYDVTLSQMEATALEAGIDPRFLRAAVEELQRRSAPAVADMLPRWRAAALCAVVVGQVYTVSGQVLGSQRDFYLPSALAAVVGALFAGQPFLKGLRSYLAVSIVAACLTTGFVLLSIAPDHLAVAVRQALFTMLVQSLLFAAGHFAASAFAKREKPQASGLRERLEAAQAPVEQSTAASGIVADRQHE